MDNKTLRNVYEEIKNIIQWHTVDHYPSVISEEKASKLSKSLARIASFNDHAGVVFVYELLQQSFALPADLQRKFTFSELNLRYLKSKLKMSPYEELCPLFEKAIALNPEHRAVYREYIKYQWRFDSDKARSMILSTYGSLREVPKDTAAYYLEALEHEGRSAEILPEFFFSKDELQAERDYTFLFANAAKTIEEKLGWLNSYYMNAGMGMLQLQDVNMPFSMDNLVADDIGFEPVTEGPLVSIIMTAYNSSDYVGTAIQSILNQTYRNIELYVCDDVSTDETRAIIAKFAQQDSRVVPLFRSENGGTYIAKSEAMRRCNGGLVLFHDSDDWSHPNKIALEVENMLKNPDVMCFNTSWVRINQHGRFFLHFANRFGHPNPAATIMRRRPILEKIGVFDPVRTGADTEFKRRVQNVFGPKSLKNDPRVMAFGRLHEESLTRSGSAAMSEAGWSPVRALYSSSWLDRLVSGRKANQTWAPLSIRKHPIKVPYDLADIEVFDTRERFGLEVKSSDFVLAFEGTLENRHFTQVHRFLMNLNKQGYRCGVYFQDAEWAATTWQASHLLSLKYIQKFETFPTDSAKFVVRVSQKGGELEFVATTLADAQNTNLQPITEQAETGFIISPNFQPALADLAAVPENHVLVLTKRDVLGMHALAGTVFKVATMLIPGQSHSKAVLLGQNLSPDDLIEAQMLSTRLGRSLAQLSDSQEEALFGDLDPAVQEGEETAVFPVLQTKEGAAAIVKALTAYQLEQNTKVFEGADFLDVFLGTVSQGYGQWSLAQQAEGAAPFCARVRFAIPKGT